MPFTFEDMKNEDIVAEFEEAANDIAGMISKLDEHIGHFEAIENITRDNGDPSMDGHTAMEALAKVLASCVLYANEYKADPYVNPNIKKNLK